VRDTGGRGTTTFALQRALELGLAVGPRILACGQPITITGGHTWYFGGEADGEEGVRRKVRNLVKLGADFIKVIGSGGGTRNTTPWRASFDPEELRAIINAAHELGRKVTVHCLCAEAIRRAVDAGADQLEHAGFLVADERQEYDPRVAEQIATSGTPVTSTLAVGSYVVKSLSARQTLTHEESVMLERWKQLLAENIANFRALRQQGVQFVAGTDAGWRFTRFDGLTEELRLMQEGGLTTMQAIKSATSGSAQALGMAEQVGTVRMGMLADLIAVEGNPLIDYSSLNRVRLVMKEGEVTFGPVRDTGSREAQ